MSTTNRTRALAQIRSLDQKVNTELASFETAFEKLDRLDPDHRLQQAFTGAASCQALSGPAG
jgi:hypothetical protein